MIVVASALIISAPAFARTLTSIDGRHFRVVKGREATPLGVSTADEEALAEAEGIEVVLDGRGQNPAKWRFGVVVDRENGSVGLRGPLSAPAGEYHVHINARDKNGATHQASATVTLEQSAMPVGDLPVFLINGLQEPFCLKSDVTGTFGQIPNLLIGINQPWVFFDNCAECWRCSIEDLGNALGSALLSQTYSDGSPVPVFDIISHSMGGLIVRCYLSGKQKESGVFNPPKAPKIRKAIFIAAPHFGSFLALRLGQSSEMQLGSQFIWDLSTWNQFGDDLRGIDAIAIAGNAAGNSDGVVELTSASLSFARSNERTRILNFCHIDPTGVAAALPRALSSSGIANVTDSTHPTWRIIASFLTDSDEWKTIEADPTQDPYLSSQTGINFVSLNAEGNAEQLSSATYEGPTTSVLSLGPTPTIAYNSFVDAGAFMFTDVVSGQSYTSGTATSQPGGWRSWWVTFGPGFTAVTSDRYGGRGNTIASDSDISFVGANLVDPSGLTSVTANGMPLTLLSQSENSITAYLPRNFGGLVKLTVVNSNGLYSENIMVGQPQPGIFAVVNAASSKPGAISPGDLVTVYGTGLGPDLGIQTGPSGGTYPVAAGGTTVNIAGLPCPLVYVSASQVNVMVPFEITGHVASVTVSHNGVNSQPFWARVEPTAAGIFALADGTGIVQKSDYSLVSDSNPATPGETVILYATGGGKTSPPTQTGAIAPAAALDARVSVSLSGRAGTVVYAGTAPGEISGLVQINVRIPSGVSGVAVPVVLSIDGVASSPVTLPIAQSGGRSNQPVILAITPIQAANNQEIVIDGSGFGNTGPQQETLNDGSVVTLGCNVTTPTISIQDSAAGADSWQAGLSTCGFTNTIGIFLLSWTDSEIVLGGFGSALGNASNPSLLNVAPGDPLTVTVTVPGASPANYTLGVSPSTPAIPAGGTLVSVPSNPQFSDTGIAVMLGQTVTISASGLASVGVAPNGPIPFVPPAGFPTGCAAALVLYGNSTTPFPDPTLPCFSLIGQIGNGEIFEVGTAASFQAESSGELFLGINDNYIGDNSGAWYASILVTGTTH
jgi:uncharacterized protein (TIGR03437 family)